MGSYHRYPVTSAASYVNKPAMEAWIVDPDTRYLDRDLENAMRLVVKKQDLDLVRFLVERYPEEGSKREVYLYEACIVAIQYGKVEIVQQTLDTRGFDVHMRTDRFRLGLLMTAILECDPKFMHQIVRILLSNGVNPNWKLPEHRHGDVTGSPLQRACALGYVEVVKALVEHGADVNASSIGKRGGWSGRCTPPPLIHAIRSPDGGEIVQVLLEHGADPLCRIRWKTVLVKVDESPHEEEGNNMLWKGKDSRGRNYSLVPVDFYRRKDSRKQEKASVAAKNKAMLGLSKLP
ncbi:ankyrin repeat-containing domain protein [Aspergillus heterothallicus]